MDLSQREYTRLETCHHYLQKRMGPFLRIAVKQSVPFAVVSFARDLVV